MTPETTLVILGASGDLTSRLLLPALGQLLQREPERRVRLLGAAMEDWDDAHWQKVVRDGFASSGAESALDTVVETGYRQADITDAATLRDLITGHSGRVALYFAVPPGVAAKACEALTRVDVPEGLILALEKPFGTDQHSAHALNETLRSIVPERQVFRVDHFLGRSTVLNLLGVRFANRLFEPAWSAEHIESVFIRYDESLGLEGRAGYYDRAGALVDMIQSHLLQVLAVLAMGSPATLDEADVRGERSAVLRATRIWQDDPVGSSRRGRYTAGDVEGRHYGAYRDEPGVDPSRQTETLAEVRLEVRTARWAGVPFTLRSGKALAARHAEIVVAFRPARHVPEGFHGEAPGAIVRFILGPDRVEVELNMNAEDDPLELERVTLAADLGPGQLLAYGEVLSGVLDGDAALSVRGDSAEQCWRIVAPVLEAWRRGDVPLQDYPAGSTGFADSLAPA